MKDKLRERLDRSEIDDYKLQFIVEDIDASFRERLLAHKLLEAKRLIRKLQDRLYNVEVGGLDAN